MISYVQADSIHEMTFDEIRMDGSMKNRTTKKRNSAY